MILSDNRKNDMGRTSILIGLGSEYGYQTAGIGKDTCADYLVAKYGFTKFSFSDPLYREVSEAFEVAIPILQDRVTKELPSPLLALHRCKDLKFVRVCVNSGLSTSCYASLSPRQILQWWGTEYRRAQNENYWVEEATQWLDKQPAGSKLVNTALRFPNEATLVRQRRGKVWLLSRTYNYAIPQAMHCAEVGILPLEGDTRIDNSGSISDLHDSIDKIMYSFNIP